jgi:hypothetical protein
VTVYQSQSIHFRSSQPQPLSGFLLITARAPSLFFPMRDVGRINHRRANTDRGARQPTEEEERGISLLRKSHDAWDTWMNRLAKYVPRCPWRSRRSYQLHQPDSFILSPLWIAWLEHENIIASRESLCLLCTFSSCSHLNGALQFTVQLFGLARNNESISCALLVVSFTNTVQTSLSLAVSSKYR